MGSPINGLSLIPNRNLPDDFFDQMLSAAPSWPDLPAAPPYDESSLLAARLLRQQIDSAQQQQQQNQLLLSSASTDSDPSFKPPNAAGAGLKGSRLQHSQMHQPLQGAAMPQQSFGGSPAKAACSPAIVAGGAPPRQRVRARRGQATDPHSIAERLRRERIAERMKALQELVPNANKTDKASMLDEIIDYVKFLQLQVKVLSMSRLGGAAAVSPLIPGIQSEGKGLAAAASEAISTENLVAKLMEEDMGSAMQYLQGKGLCLMPISLASAISAATSPSAAAGRLVPVIPAGGDAPLPPSSPSMSVLTVQSAVAGAGGDACVSRCSGKDAS